MEVSKISKTRFTTTTRKDIASEPLHVCILAGSVGYRQKSSGPRVLQVHDGETILEHQVKTVLHSYVDAIISITAGFQADKVVRNRPQISLIENQLFETTNSLEEVRLYLNTVFPSRLLLIDGAVYFNNFALNITDSTSVLLYENNDPKEIGVQCSEGIVEHFEYNLEDKWSGLVYIEGKDIDTLKRVVKRENNKLSLFEGLNLMLELDTQFKAVKNNRAEVVKL